MNTFDWLIIVNGEWNTWYKSSELSSMLWIINTHLWAQFQLSGLSGRHLRQAVIFFNFIFYFCQTLFPPSIFLVSWEVLRELMESYGLILDKDVNNVQSYRWDFLKHAVVVHVKFHWDKIWLSTSSYLFSLGKLWQMTVSQSEVSVRTRHIHHNEIN